MAVELTTQGIKFSDGTEQKTAANNKGGLAATGEIWRDVTSSRANGGTYTNTRSYPIQISMVGGYSGSSHTWAYVDGKEVWSHGAQWNGPGAIGGGGGIIVPPGSTYSFYSRTGVVKWWELY